jgi:hypothetical protein
VPPGKSGFLLLLDEFNSSATAVQAAAYKLILDRQVGMYNLHHKCAVMAAGNLSTDKAIVNRISTAMQSRLIHFEIEVDVKGWIKWADTHDIDHRIKSFINFKPEALHKFDPNHNESTFPCPRTWDFMSRLVARHEKLDSKKIPLLSGCVGEGMAREFFSYCQIYGDLPTIHGIIKDPENVKFGNEPSIHFALTGLVSHHFKKDNADKLMTFLNRLSLDFQVIALRSILAKHPEYKDNDAIRGWIIKNSKELI